MLINLANGIKLSNTSTFLKQNEEFSIRVLSGSFFSSIFPEQEREFRNSWNVELPVPTTFRQQERCGQVIEKISAGDGFGTQGGEVRGRLLAVHEAKFPRLELAHERDQRDFRGIGCTGEHRLCEKGAS